MQPLGTKKVTRPLSTKKITQPIGKTKNQTTSWGGKGPKNSNLSHNQTSGDRHRSPWSCSLVGSKGIEFFRQLNDFLGVRSFKLSTTIHS